eukprot:6066105-Pyramimonas_sp.AAC.1
MLRTSASPLRTPWAARCKSWHRNSREEEEEDAKEEGDEQYYAETNGNDKEANEGIEEAEAE